MRFAFQETLKEHEQRGGKGRLVLRILLFFFFLFVSTETSKPCFLPVSRLCVNASHTTRQLQPALWLTTEPGICLISLQEETETWFTDMVSLSEVLGIGDVLLCCVCSGKPFDVVTKLHHVKLLLMKKQPRDSNFDLVGCFWTAVEANACEEVAVVLKHFYCEFQDTFLRCCCWSLGLSWRIIASF